MKTTKFLIRFFTAFLLLLILCVLDKYSYLNLDEIKNKITYNINPLELINKLNGNINLINLGTTEEITVSKNYNEYQIIDNKRRYNIDEFSYVNNYIAGVVIKIEKKDKYNVTILGIDNLEYHYSNLDSFNYNIYEYVKTDQILGDATNYYELMIDEN